MEGKGEVRSSRIMVLVTTSRAPDCKIADLAVEKA